MSSTNPTISFLRSLTWDGVLSGEEIWSLAQFLNDNPECQDTWPGNLLFPMLHSAFDDGALSEEEMSVLAATIGDIEQEWLTNHAPPAPEPALEPMDLPPLVKPSMPSMDVQVQIPSTTQDHIFIVNLRDHTCTCPESGSRRHWPSGHPGRCCKHVAHAFVRTGKVLPPCLQAILDDCFKRARGTEPADDWVLLKTSEKWPIVCSGGAGDWCAVFSPNLDGYEKFGFNYRQRRWSYGDAPPAAGVIEEAIRTAFRAA